MGALTEIQNESALLDTQHANLQDKITQIQSEKQATTAEVDALRRTLESQEHDLKSVREQLERLRRRRSVLNLACDQLPKASVGVVPSPLTGVATEAAGLAQNYQRSLEQQLTETASKTVEYDRERGVFEAEERELLPKLEDLRTKQETLNQIYVGHVDALKWATSDVEKLQTERDDLVHQLMDCSKALRDAEQTREAMESKILSEREDDQALRDMAWNEISAVRDKCSKTSRVKQCAALESEKQQKDLLTFASAHAQYISQTGTHQASVQLPNGLLDTGSPEMRRAIQQASQPRSARGMRSDFKEFGQIIVRSN